VKGPATDVTARPTLTACLVGVCVGILCGLPLGVAYLAGYREGVVQRSELHCPDGLPQTCTRLPVPTKCRVRAQLANGYTEVALASLGCQCIQQLLPEPASATVDLDRGAP
jgi:hypothetical protein